MKLTLANVLTAKASDFSTLVPKGKFQFVVAEVTPYLMEQDVMDSNMKKTGKKEIVTQIVFSFEIQLDEERGAGRKAVDSRGFTIIGSNGYGTNIHGDRSAIAKFFDKWSGGKRGDALDVWFGDYLSFVGRNGLLTIDHEEKGQKKTIVANITDIEELPVNIRTKQCDYDRIEVSPDYVPFLERNKSQFIETPDGIMRIFKAADTEEGESEPAANEQPSQTTTRTVGNGKKSQPPKHSVDGAPEDKDIPF